MTYRIVVNGTVKIVNIEEKITYETLCALADVEVSSKPEVSYKTKFLVGTIEAGDGAPLESEAQYTVGLVK